MLSWRTVRRRTTEVFSCHVTSREEGKSKLLTIEEATKWSYDKMLIDGVEGPDREIFGSRSGRAE